MKLKNYTKRTFFQGMVLVLIIIMSCVTYGKEPDLDRMNSGNNVTYSSLKIIYNKHTYISDMKQFEENGAKVIEANKRSDGTTVKKPIIVIKKKSKVYYKINKKVDTCVLTIVSLKNNKMIKRIKLIQNKVPTNFTKGLYSYDFNVDWEKGNAKHEMLINLQ